MNSHFYQVGRFLFRSQRMFLGSLLVSFVLAVLFFRITGLNWWQWGEPVLTLATLVIGVIIWHGEVREDWEDALPKRLTAEFELDSCGQPRRLVMAARFAPLVGESDIRTWGIALGAQMNRGKRQLRYQPFFDASPPEITVDPSGATCRHYRIRFILEEIPERLAEFENTHGRPLCIEWNLKDGQPHEELIPAGSRPSAASAATLCLEPPTT